MPLIWDHIPLFEGTRRVLGTLNVPIFARKAKTAITGLVKAHKKSPQARPKSSDSFRVSFRVPFRVPFGVLFSFFFLVGFFFRVPFKVRVCLRV